MSRILLLLTFFLTAFLARAQPEAAAFGSGPKLIPVSALLSKEAVKALTLLPVQDDGRIKPLDTIARYKLLKLYGRSSIPAVIEGESRKLSAVEWMMLCWFRPDEAKK